MDHFLEEIVVRRNRALQEILYYLGTVTMIVAALIAFWMLTGIFNAFSIVGLVILLVFGAIAVLLYLYKDRTRTEFEYTFTNGDLDFAQVFNNQKRKNLGTMTQYDETFTGLDVVNPPESLHNTLGEYLSSLGKTQLRIAETQKYAHEEVF